MSKTSTAGTNISITEDATTCTFAVSDAELNAIAALTSAADKGIQFTGSGMAATYDLTAAGKALLDDASASAQRTTLGLAIGTNVQAWDVQLDDVAGLTPTDNGVVIGNGTNFVVESGATLKTSLGLTIGTDIQAHSAVLDNTTASFLEADETKLDGIEALADVTNDTNVKAALDGMALSDIGTPASDDKVLIQDTSDSNNLKYVEVSELGGGSGTPGGSDTQVQFNDSSAFGGDAGLTFNKTSNVLSVNAGIIVGGNSTGAGYVSFLEDSDNGTNTCTLVGPASTADVTVTLPSATDTIVGKATTDTLTNKTIDADGSGNVITNIGSSEVKSELITGQSTVTADGADYVLISDSSDSGNLKKALASDLGGGGGAVVKISTQTASASANLEFTGLDSSTYRAYFAIFEGIHPATDSTDLQMYWGDVGSGYVYNHNYNLKTRTSSDTGAEAATGNSDYVVLAQSLQNDATDGPNWGLTGRMDIVGHDTVDPDNWNWMTTSKTCHYNGAARVWSTCDATGYENDVNYTKIKFQMSSGNITSGLITLYGITA